MTKAILAQTIPEAVAKKAFIGYRLWDGEVIVGYLTSQKVGCISSFFLDKNLDFNVLTWLNE